MHRGRRHANLGRPLSEQPFATPPSMSPAAAVAKEHFSLSATLRDELHGFAQAVTMVSTGAEEYCSQSAAESCGSRQDGPGVPCMGPGRRWTSGRKERAKAAAARRA